MEMLIAFSDKLNKQTSHLLETFHGALTEAMTEGAEDLRTPHESLQGKIHGAFMEAFTETNTYVGDLRNIRNHEDGGSGLFGRKHTQNKLRNVIISIMIIIIIIRWPLVARGHQAEVVGTKG